MSPGAESPEIARAWGYPWERPRHSYVLLGGVAQPVDAWSRESPLDTRLGRGDAAAPLASALVRAGLDPAGWEAETRTGLLAYGSNAAPSQLRRKFLDAERRAIPVTAVVVSDVDVVFSAHLTSYGSLPATIHRTPGARAHLAITWLTDEERSIMHRSEGGNYRLEEVPGLASVFAYVSDHGAIPLGGEVRGLSAVTVADAGRARLAQPEAVAAAARDYFPDHDARGLSEHAIADREWRRAATRTLAANAVPAILGDGPAVPPADLL